MPQTRSEDLTNKALIASVEQIGSQIFLIRGQKVMLDADLAELYEVETKELNRAVKRNIERFPEDFMFQLSADEFDNLRFQSDTSNLRSQIVISSWGGARTPPYAFTEQGVAMLSGVLRSSRAIQVNIAPSCAPSCNYDKCCPPTPSFRANWLRWKRTTTSNSERSLKPSANS